MRKGEQHSNPATGNGSQQSDVVEQSLPSRVIERGRLVDLCSDPASPVLICAPSGYGKSVLLSQLAARWGATHIIDLRFDELGLLCVESQATSSVPLIADNLNLGEMTPAQIEEVSGAISAVARQCRPVALSTPSLPTSLAPLFRDWCIVDQSDMRLDEEETARLAALHGMPDKAEQLGIRTQGQVALFLSLLDAERGAATGGAHRRHTRLIAWIRHLIEQLNPSEQQLLRCASLLESVSQAEFRTLGLEPSEEALSTIASVVPLAHVVTRNGSISLVVDPVVWQFGYSGELASRPLVDLDAQSLVSLLVGSGRLREAAKVVLQGSDDDRIRSFLRDQGPLLIERGELAAVEKLLSKLPLSSVVADAPALLLWSALESERCNDADALAKARAALVVAHHHGCKRDELRATLMVLDCLRNLGRWEEAASLATDLSDTGLAPDERQVAVQILLAAASLRIVIGDVEGANQFIEQARCDLGIDAASSGDEFGKLAELDGVLMVIEDGDSFAAIRKWSSIAEMNGCRPSRRVQAMLNMGVCLVEVGRLERATTLLQQVLATGERWFTAHSLPPLACARFGLADDASQLVSISRCRYGGNRE